MRQVTATEAKIHFLRLLDEIEGGETIVVTRHGRPIARVMPEQEAKRSQAKAALKRILQRRSAAPRISTEEILAWKNEGRG